MPAKPATVTEYLRSLPKDRRDTIQAVRKVIKANLDKDYREGIQYGMLAYHVPLSVYPDGYHCNPKEPLPYVTIGPVRFAVQRQHSGSSAFRTATPSSSSCSKTRAAVLR